MITLRSISRIAVKAGTLSVAAGIAFGAAAAPSAHVSVPRVAIPVAANCNAVGQQIAAEKGGSLADAYAETRGGQPVCVVVVVLPARNGERGRRSEVVVPQD